MIRLLSMLSLLIMSYGLSAKGRIAAVSPIAHSMSQALLQGSQVTVTYLPPKRLPINRIASWLTKNRSIKQQPYDAFVTVSSIKPELDFFPSLRQSNIRVIKVDIANAIMVQGEKVVQANRGEYFWLNTNNQLVMLGILKRDLIRIWPQHQTIINQNYHQLSVAIRQTNLKLDGLLADYDIAVLSSQSERITPFAASLASDLMSQGEAQALGLPFLQLNHKKAAPSDWQIDDFSRYKNTPFIQRIEHNVSSLNVALNAVSKL